MAQCHGKFKAFKNSRWLVFVCAMWIQSFAGIGYLFGSISPVIKSTMGYTQRELAILGVAKDWGDAIGFVAGYLSEILPSWGLLVIGAVLNFLGYGLLWLIVSQKIAALPLWVLCIAIYVGTNGETFFNTAALISCVQNFPKSRGPVVGILKGYAGLSGAIITQIYAMFNSPNEASLLFMIAVGPSMVVIALMFIVRPVGGHRQVRPGDKAGFTFTYSVCLVLAAYLLGVLILEDLFDLSQTLITLLAAILVVFLVLPIIIPIILSFFSEPKPLLQESLIDVQREDEGNKSENEVIFSEVEDEKASDVDSLPSSERQKRISQLQAKLFQAAADGAVRVKRRKGPHRGENFTLMQALIKADFWLIFVSLLLAAGSGLTVIDNLGQIVLSLGYTDTSIYVSMISIWNFLGRVGGGYFSEIIVRDYAYPRPVVMAVVQVIMAVGLFYYAVGLPGQIYVSTVLIGLGYGAHWAILPAAASELFGLKSFGALYNFLTMANPAGSLIFSEVIASGIYDYYAEKQATLRHQNPSSMLLKPLGDDDDLSCEGTICYSITFGILSALCIVAAGLSMIVVYRTRRVYTQLYGNPNN
ncbi:PREDICTED: protein NUCLEAR FUSION DEFECTIVE 4-like [Fragaria vesca subsp. vesca]|uniref:protein NUCLEAR FUSION DEFECTIVE 4-like n=1 Tax=Fragaria vesca subsp. vesca TaxID=101020 RepID=UPI0002C2E522|nr:PREDICTED: protein NUCLEAR FUSION DEFECTIVE 4-like [Fragaria vesca subsp. vesca]